MNTADVVGLLAYVGFAFACLRVAMATRGGARTRHAARAATRGLIAWVVAVGAVTAYSQVDLWPFSAWALMTGTPPAEIGDNPMALELAAVDAAGVEHPVDFRAVEPLAFDELRGWWRTSFFTLPVAARDSAAQWVLARVNASRARVRAGGSAAARGAWMGPLRASYHALHPAWWNRPTDVPDTPFVALRIYREWWSLAARAADPAAGRRVKVYDSDAHAAAAGTP